jgi:hypothetical protein
VQTDPNLPAMIAAGSELIVPPAPDGHTAWTEMKELRGQFLSREPLWPGGSGS